MSTENELATQEGAPAEAPESAPENTVIEEQQTEETVEQQPEVTENTEEKGADPSVPLKQLIEQRKKRQRAEQEAAYWRGQAEARGTTQVEQPKPAPQVQQPQSQPVAPSLDNFETYEEYEKAKEEHLIQVAEWRFTQKILQQQQQQAQSRVVNDFEKRFAEAAKDDPSLIEIRNDTSLPVSQVMAQLIQRSEIAPQILKYLNSNRDEASKIAQMDPISVAMAFGRIEGTIKSTPKPQTKKVSSAPAPISTVQTTAPASVDEDDLPMEEYYKRRTKKMYGR